MNIRLKNIKELPAAGRPREKFMIVGPSGLSNAELIAIILRSGSQAIPLVMICKNLIEYITDNIATLGAMSVEQITLVKGIGEVKAMELLAAIELGKRSLRQAAPLNLRDDESIEKLIKPYLSGQQNLQYHLVLINNRKELLATCELQTDPGKLPDLKEIIRLVLESGAVELMLCRNEIKVPARYRNEEKAYVVQLDAAASMLKINVRGLLIIT